MPKKDKWDFIAKAVQEARADETADSRTSSVMSTRSDLYPCAFCGGAVPRETVPCPHCGRVL